MKKILMFTFSLFFFIGAYAQVLTFDQLLLLKGKDLEGVEEYLTAKKWSFVAASEADATNCEIARFAHGQSEFDPDMAVAFFRFIVCTGYKRVFYQFHKKDTYLAITKRLKDLGYKTESSKIEDGNIVKVYLNNSYAVKIITSTAENDSGGKSTTYALTIWSKADYNSD